MILTVWSSQSSSTKCTVVVFGVNLALFLLVSRSGAEVENVTIQKKRSFRKSLHPLQIHVCNLFDSFDQITNCPHNHHGRRILRSKISSSPRVGFGLVDVRGVFMFSWKCLLEQQAQLLLTVFCSFRCGFGFLVQLKVW